ncbi:hypothetical protein DMENIID0001_014000 [Sergentomyia squamirostris]
MVWSRSENLKFPQTWYTFEAKDPDTGNIVTYRVEDLTEDRFEEVEHLMETIFNRDEVVCKSIDAVNDQQFTAARGCYVKKVLTQKVSLVCYKEGSDEICGVNLLEVLEKESEEKSLQDPTQVRTVIRKVVNHMKVKADLFNKYNTDKYIYAIGLLVIPKYRGLNLATEILKARVPLGRGLCIELTGTIFTGIPSQKAAEKAGFVDDYTVSYEDLKNNEPFVNFTNIACPTVKFMSMKLIK